MINFIETLYKGLFYRKCRTVQKDMDVFLAHLMMLV